MEDLYGVEGNKDLARDPSTNAVVNVNDSEYRNYLARREAKSKKTQRVQNLEEDLANMKEDIDEIKSLLKELLNGPK
tara:strand:- start:213 stop:443 length:231 start_codon:yes stop_codon:yes gene_type:complete